MVAWGAVVAGMGAYPALSRECREYRLAVSHSKRRRGVCLCCSIPCLGERTFAL